MAITLPADTKQQIIASLRRYFTEHLDQDIGDLKAELLLDYVLREIGPTVYNRAISHAQAYMVERAEDLAGTCYERELTYWIPGEAGHGA